MTADEDRFCIHCGKPGPWRDDNALKCTACDKSTAESRSTYQKIYQRAKSAALRVLIERHRDEFELLLRSERMKQHQAAKRKAS